MRINYPSRLLWCLLLWLASLAGARAQQVAAPALGKAAAYGLLSGDDLVATDQAGNPLPIRVQGRAGARNAIGAGVRASAGTYDQGSDSVPDALNDAKKASDYCTDLGGSSLTGELDGQTLGGGAYAVSGDARLSGGARLTLTGDTATVIVLNITGSLALDERAGVVLSGVLPQHVFWNVGSYLTVASGADFSGVALAGGRIALSGFHFGRCALLGQQDIVLTDLSASIGTNQFYAAARTTTTCFNGDPEQPCVFSRPDGELLDDGSFEMARCLPTGPDMLSDACFWENPTGGTPDYFIAGADADVSTPDNRYAILYRQPSQPPVPQGVQAMGQNSSTQAGQAYAGFYGYNEQLANTFEYVMQKHDAQPLQTVHHYYVEMAIQLAPCSKYELPAVHLALAPARWTAPAGEGQLTPPTLAPLLTVSGERPSGTLSGPSHNWRRQGLVFSPTTNMTGFRVVIGNMAPVQLPLQNGISSSLSTAPLSKCAYYYVDNVSLSMVTEAGPNVTLGAACLGGNGASSVALGTLPMPSMVGATYAWTASPADPSLTTPTAANPTVSPTQTTTYTLTVSIPVPGWNSTTSQPQTQTQTYTSSVTVTVASNNYVQNPGATYVNPTAGGAVYDIGTSGTGTTTLDAGGGTITFDGRYHVLGNVRLTNGTFTLAPGTTFFVEGQAIRRPALTPGGGTVRSVSGSTITVGDEARLVLNQATITAAGNTATCLMWRGIVVEGNLPAGSPAQVDIRNGSVVSHAYCALTITRTNTTALGVAYSLTDSYFRHNLTHVLDMGIRKGPGGPALIQNCTFDADPALMHYPYNTTRASDQYVTYQALQLLPYSDANADAVQVTDNTIRHAVYGIVNNVTGGGQTNVLIASNTLTDIYQTGIWAADNQAQPQGSNTVPTISDNTIRLSGLGGQVTEQLPASATLFGLTSENSQPVYQRSALRNNEVYGDASSSKTQVGISLYYQVDASSNSLFDLSEGIRTTSLDNSTVFDNALSRCRSGVTVQPRTPYGYQAQITCNSFYRSGASGLLRGIWAVDYAEFNDQGSFSSPAGNAFFQFSNTDEKVRNDGDLSNPTPINYYQTTSSLEAVSSVVGNSGGPSITTLIAGGYCTGPNGNGVSRGTVPSPGYIAALADTVRRQLVPRPRRRAYLNEVLHYYQEQGQLAELDAWWATLLPLNPEDYRTTGLSLLHAYDQQATTTSNAQRVLTALQPQALLDADLAAELSLRQVERHLPHTAPALTAADSTTLTALAGSGVAAAGRAGRWLRYFHPSLDVPTTSPDPWRTTARPAATPPAKPAQTAQLGEAYPNPARTEVQIACQLPAGAPGGVLRLTDLVTGRTVLEVPVPASEQAAPLRLALDQLAPGTYAYRLLVDGRPVAGARKLVVIP